MTNKRYTAKELRDMADAFDETSRIYRALRQAAADSEKLDWLAMQFVVVRIPGRYGSRLAFEGIPKIDIEGLDEDPFNIRAAIDKARTQEKEND